MTIRERLQTDLKEAIRAGQEQRKTVIRGVIAALNEVEQRNREDLVRKALKKHNVMRPTDLEDAAAMAAYQQAVDSALATESVEDRRVLDEGEALGVIQRLTKQRQESIEQARQGGRADIADAEARELAILEAYLPRQMSREEVEAEARAVIAEVGAKEPRDMGRVMTPLMARLQGRAEGKLVSDVVRSLLTG